MFNQKFLINVDIRELHYWYLPRTRLAKTFPGASDNCWRCGLLKGTFFTYGGNVFKCSLFGMRFTAKSDISDFFVPFEPRILLLHDVSKCSSLKY